MFAQRSSQIMPEVEFVAYILCFFFENRYAKLKLAMKLRDLDDEYHEL